MAYLSDQIVIDHLFLYSVLIVGICILSRPYLWTPSSGRQLHKSKDKYEIPILLSFSNSIVHLIGR